MSSHDEAPAPTVMPLDDLRRLIRDLACALRQQLGPRAAVIIAAGFPRDDNHDRFASFVTGPCLMSRGLLAWSQRSVECQIDDADTSIGDDGRVK